MWQYQKKLQFPVNIKNPNPQLASYIISQYGGAYCKSLSILSNPEKARIYAGFELFNKFQKQKATD